MIVSKIAFLIDVVLLANVEILPNIPQLIAGRAIDRQFKSLANFNELRTALASSFSSGESVPHRGPVKKCTNDNTIIKLNMHTHAFF